VIVGDQDGIVVIERELATEVARLDALRIEKEERSREKLKAGELGVDFYCLRVKLIDLGVDYVDD
jgi:4-hydroxy-4-methyl-2-oxoglutarate aldolase